MVGRRGLRGRQARPCALLITCEHGGNRIPGEYRELFAGFAGVLASHRGYDPGALLLARELAAALHAPLVSATVSRLLVELNRSPGHAQLFSERTRALSASERARIVARYYQPYRREVEERVQAAVAQHKRVLHISSHSFTPVLAGEVRNADVGLLYDPRRGGERQLCERWCALLCSRSPALAVRRNYPYRGSADGLTTFLRKRFDSAAYLGIEIEINQRYVLAAGRPWRTLRHAVVASLQDLLHGVETVAPGGARLATPREPKELRLA